jgi:hypothetical protein
LPLCVSGCFCLPLWAWVGMGCVYMQRYQSDPQAMWQAKDAAITVFMAVAARAGLPQVPP